MQPLRYIILISSVLFLLACSPSEVKIEELISVTGGQIEGQILSNGIKSYKGIPFAAPPVGDLRWQAPQPVVPWDGVLECKQFGPSPVQPAPRPFMFWSSEFLIPEEPINEDCLHLNVWSGAKTQEDKRPVLVYIYGGGFQSGGSACPIYDGNSMAEKGLVFVSINYRVGKFGFLAHPELSKESASGTSGNYGILDMIAALEWVQQNIEAFGGDPNNVTIAGQSAGAFGVNYLTASPLATGLFQKAIAQSGGSFYKNPLRPNLTMQQAENLGLDFARSLEVNSISELRTLDAKTILSSSGGLSAPFMDGYVLENSIYETYASGQQNDIPLLLGWNKNDIVMGAPLDEEPFRKMIKRRFGALEDEFYNTYSSGSAEQIKLVQFNMNRDEVFGSQVYTWAKMQDRTGNAPVFLYNFNREVPANSIESSFGAFHSSEIVYAYDNLHTLDRPWEEADEQIADIMSSYWANFATTGNPNGKGLPEWESFSTENQVVMVIDKDSRSIQLPDRTKLEFWERYYQK